MEFLKNLGVGLLFILLLISVLSIIVGVFYLLDKYGNSWYLLYTSLSIIGSIVIHDIGKKLRKDIDIFTNER